MTSRSWNNGPLGNTPITAAALNGMESDIATAVSSAAASATSAANSAALVGAPADTAIAAAIQGTGTATAAALNAAYVPKWQPLTAYTAGYAVLSPTGDVVTAATGFTSGASFNAADWLISTSYEQAGNAAAFAIVFGG